MSGFGAPSRSKALTIEAVRDTTGTFDIDAYHVMNERDNALIAQEVVSGAGSSKFVYAFEVSGKPVSGISVIGARHLANAYGGIKHRMIASVLKVGPLFEFTSYPFDGNPMDVNVKLIDALKAEDDFYEVLIEIADIKTGNSIQVRKRETAQERRRDGTKFDRPHYTLIADSKAYRNGVLALVDQAVQLEWKERMLQLDKADIITSSIVEEKRAAVLRFAAAKSVPIDRRSLEALTMDQLAGLGDAARGGNVDAFRNSCDSLRVLHTIAVVEGGGPERLAGPAKPAAKPGERAPAPPQDPPAAAASRPAATTVSKPAVRPVEPLDHRAAEHGAANGNGNGAAKARPFRACIADEFGAMLENEVGQPETFTSPSSYLERLMGMANEGNVVILMENNADDIELARNLTDPHDFDQAMEQLAMPRQPRDQRDEPEAPRRQREPALAVPKKSGKSDLQGYLAAVTQAVAAITVIDDLMPWVESNEPVFGELPTVTRKAVLSAIEARRAALSAPRTEDAPQQDRGGLGLPDPASDELAALLRQVNGCTTRAEMAVLEGPAFTARFNRLPPQAQKTVRDAAVAVRTRVANAEKASAP